MQVVDPRTLDNTWAPTTSEDQVDDLEEIFERFDRNDSGFVELSELDDLLAAMGLDSHSDHALYALSKLETADPSRVSLRELQAWWAGPASAISMGEAGPDPEMAAKLRDIFDKFDADGSGTIDVGELKRMLAAVDLGFTNESIYAAIQSVDRNGDSVMQWSEFLHFWTIVERT